MNDRPTNRASWKAWSLLAALLGCGVSPSTTHAQPNPNAPFQADLVAPAAAGVHDAFEVSLTVSLPNGFGDRFAVSLTDPAATEIEGPLSANPGRGWWVTGGTRMQAGGAVSSTGIPLIERAGAGNTVQTVLRQWFHCSQEGTGTIAVEGEIEYVPPAGTTADHLHPDDRMANGRGFMRLTGEATIQCSTSAPAADGVKVVTPGSHQGLCLDDPTETAYGKWRGNTSRAPSAGGYLVGTTFEMEALFFNDLVKQEYLNPDGSFEPWTLHQTIVLEAGSATEPSGKLELAPVPSLTSHSKVTETVRARCVAPGWALYSWRARFEWTDRVYGVKRSKTMTCLMPPLECFVLDGGGGDDRVDPPDPDDSEVPPEDPDVPPPEEVGEGEREVPPGIPVTPGDEATGTDDCACSADGTARGGISAAVALVAVALLRRRPHG